MICLHPPCNNYTKRQYCSSICRGKHQSWIIVQAWKNGNDIGYKKGYRLKRAVRLYILEKYNHKCSKCGWNEINSASGTSPIEVDHIDGNCSNCKEENLIVLCPNCHALTPTYKALNKGNGIRNRHEYSKLVDHS